VQALAESFNDSARVKAHGTGFGGSGFSSTTRDTAHEQRQKGLNVAEYAATWRPRRREL
jgi:hypothetical protein